MNAFAGEKQSMYIIAKHGLSARYVVDIELITTEM